MTTLLIKIRHMSIKPEELLILGITIDDHLFHPRDWAERLCGISATYNNGRLVYSKFLHPVMRKEHRFMSVVVETELKNAHPQAYAFTMDFVRNNRLKMTIGRRVVRQSDLTIIDAQNSSRWAHKFENKMSILEEQ